MNRKLLLSLVLSLIVFFGQSGSAGLLRDADPLPVDDPSLDINSVAARRMENGRLLFEIATVGAPRLENVRIFLNTDPSIGAPDTGANFMMEGPRFYSRPARARGWQWDEIEAPVVAIDGRRLICVLPPVPELGQGAWIVETTDAEFNTVDRVPNAGSVQYKLSELPLWEPPMRAVPADIHDLLDYSQFSLSVRLETEMKKVRWEEIEVPLPRFGWMPAGADASTPLIVSIKDIETGESVALEPDKAWQGEETLRFDGEALGIQWTLLLEPAGTGAVQVTGLLADHKRDRCVSVELRSPLDGTGWIWHDDFRTQRMVGEGDLARMMPSPFGLRSLYPFAVVSRDDAILMAETDPLEPRMFRILASGDEPALVLQYDLALTSQTSNFPGLATFRCAFRSMQRADANAFRQAAADFHERYPARQLPPISQISAARIVRLDPGVQQVPMSPGMARNEENVDILLRLGLMEHGRGADLAAATLLGACIGVDGKPSITFDESPWFAGASVPVSMDPDTRPTAEWPVTRAMAEWRFVREQMEGRQADAVLFESVHLEAPDYRGAALGVADYPSVFEPGVLKPCLANSFSGYEFMALVSRSLSARGKILAGGRVAEPSPFHIQQLDAVMEEVGWLDHGNFLPDDVDSLIARRVLAGKRPVMILLNGPFNTISTEAKKQGLEESLFWGFVPVFHMDVESRRLHKDNPDWMRRDQALINTYTPLAARLADARWNPAGFASVEPGTIRLEHYGADQAVRHITIRNDDSWVRDARLRVNGALGELMIYSPLNGECASAGEEVVVRLLPGEIQMLDVFAPADIDRELAFLESWAGGVGEGAFGRVSLESVKVEKAADVECAVFVPVPCVREDANRLRLVVSNNGDNTIRVSGLRVIGKVFRETTRELIEIAPGAVSTSEVSFMATDIPAIGWLEVNWNISKQDSEWTSRRFVRPHVVAPLEFRALPANVEAVGLESSLELIVINHSSTAKSFTVTWRGDFRGGMRDVNLEPLSTKTILLPVRARRAGEGEMHAVVEQDEQRIAVLRYDVHFLPDS